MQVMGVLVRGGSEGHRVRSSLVNRRALHDWGRGGLAKIAAHIILLGRVLWARIAWDGHGSESLIARSLFRMLCVVHCYNRTIVLTLFSINGRIQPES